MTPTQHPTGRLVWITQEQRDRTKREHGLGDPLVAAFDAAPADPVEALRHQLVERYGVKHVTTTMLADVLRALGWEAS